MLIWVLSWIVMKQILRWIGPFDFSALHYLLECGAVRHARPHPPAAVAANRDDGPVPDRGLPGAGAMGAKVPAKNGVPAAR
jgi:hypothetical protein